MNEKHSDKRKPAMDEFGDIPSLEDAREIADRAREEIEFHREELEHGMEELHHMKHRFDFNGDVKSISIRGVNADIYDQFVNKIKTLDLNIGDAITKLMKDVNATFDEEFPELSAHSLKLMSLGRLSISHHDNLTISKQDLIEPERQVSFSHCRNLRFEPDIDKNTFLQYVRGINHCRGVYIPKVLPKLLLLSRIRFCEDVEFYEVE